MLEHLHGSQRRTTYGNEIPLIWVPDFQFRSLYAMANVLSQSHLSGPGWFYSGVPICSAADSGSSSAFQSRPHSLTLGHPQCPLVTLGVPSLVHPNFRYLHDSSFKNIPCLCFLKETGSPVRTLKEVRTGTPTGGEPGGRS